MSQNLSIFEQAGKDIPEGLSDNKVKTIFEATGLDWVVEQKPVYIKKDITHPAAPVDTACYDILPRNVWIGHA